LATATDCSGDVEISFRDSVEKFDCTSDTGQVIEIIERTWTAVDIHGNIASGVQRITVRALPRSALRFPNPFVELSCSQGTSIAEISTAKGFRSARPYYRSPRTNGDRILPLTGELCDYVGTFEDSPPIYTCKENCLASYKFIRTWTVMNWCTGDVSKGQQLIAVLDTIAPEIAVTSPATEYSVNAWGCDVDITLPSAVVRDNCDPDAAIVQVEGPFGVNVVRVNGRWIARAVPSGIHTFTYTASDCCGNLSTAEIRVIVKDRVAPVATAKEFITVSLTQSGDDSIPGVAKLFVNQVDNGSYDNCTEVYMEMRREDDAPACLNEGELWNHDNNGSTPEVAWNNNRTYNSRLNGLDQTTDLHLQDNALDTDQGQFVKFCCEDIGEEVKVWLRVWDDANGSGIFGDTIDGMGDNYNETWTMVKVEDKIVPSIECVPYVETSCDRDTGIVTDYNFQNGKTASQIVWENIKGKVPSSLVPTAEGRM
jgi:hypothetical protein